MKIEVERQDTAVKDWIIVGKKRTFFNATVIVEPTKSEIQSMYDWVQKNGHQDRTIFKDHDPVYRYTLGEISNKLRSTGTFHFSIGVKNLGERDRLIEHLIEHLRAWKDKVYVPATGRQQLEF